MNNIKFTTDNWDATQEQCDKANAAYQIAAQTFFEGVEHDDIEKINRLEKSLTDKIGNYFNDALSAEDIAHWALSK